MAHMIELPKNKSLRAWIAANAETKDGSIELEKLCRLANTHPDNIKKGIAKRFYTWLDDTKHLAFVPLNYRKIVEEKK